MAVTAFQSEVLKRIARSRIDGGETYIAGGLALNHLLKRPRVSSDVDVFNSTYSALERAADHDCEVLKASGYDIRVTRRRDYVVEVVVSRDGGSTELQWVQDSAYRFFPLVEDELLGLTLHPFDLATNKLAIKNAADYDIGDLSQKWHDMIWRAREMVKLLPPAEVGKVVMTREGELFKGDDATLQNALADNAIVFHEGTIGGAWPVIVG